MGNILKHLRKMLSIDYLTYGGDRNPEFLADGEKFFSIGAQFANLLNVGWRKSGLISDPSFGRAIAHVIGLVALEQVIRAKARSVIAVVKYEHSNNGHSRGQYVGLAVNKLFFVLVPGLEKPISVGIFPARPLHAGIIGWNILKQPLQQFNVGSIVVHLRALLGSWCAALGTFARPGAFLILAQEGA